MTLLICRLSKRLFLAIPDTGPQNRQYVFARELADKSTDVATPAVEAIVEGRYREFLTQNPEFAA